MDLHSSSNIVQGSAVYSTMYLSGNKTIASPTKLFSKYVMASHGKITGITNISIPPNQYYKKYYRDIFNKKKKIKNMNNKMAITTYLSIIALNVNGLNVQIKRHRWLNE